MKKLLMLFVVLTAACSAFAEFDYFAQVAAFSGGQIPTGRNRTIYGARLSLIHGDLHRLYGLDLGFSGRVRERMCGLQIAWGFNHANWVAGAELGIVNWVESEFAGFQLGFWNRGANGAGMQLGAANMADAFAGFQCGIVNWADDLAGFQCGGWNHATDGAGMQLGIVNTSASFAGFQCGVLNWATDLDGFQLGLVNVIENQRFYVLPIANIGF